MPNNSVQYVLAENTFLLNDTDFCIIENMKTTLNLRDDLIGRAKALAAKESTTLTKMIEEGLALRLRRQKSARSVNAQKVFPVSKRRGGLRRGIDGTSNRSLLDAADG